MGRARTARRRPAAAAAATPRAPRAERRGPRRRSRSNCRRCSLRSRRLTRAWNGWLAAGRRAGGRVAAEKANERTKEAVGRCSADPRHVAARPGSAAAAARQGLLGEVGGGEGRRGERSKQVRVEEEGLRLEVEGQPQLCHFGTKRFEGGVLQLWAEIEQEMIVPQHEPRYRNDRPTAGLLEPTPATARTWSVGVDPCLASFPEAVAVVTPRDR